MNYQTAYNKIKDKLTECTFNATDENYAIQITLTNKDCGGILYVQQKDGELLCEPFDYLDNDAAVSLTLNDFMKLVEKKLDIDDAITKGKVLVEGSGRVFSLFVDSLIPPPEKESKPKTETPKKRACKKAEPKSADKKETKTAKSAAKKTK